MTGFKINDTDGNYIRTVTLYMYKCSTVLDEYIGHKDVEMTFIFTTVRKAVGQILPYELLIHGYNNLSEFAKENAEIAVGEMFFWDEVQELGAYLERYYKNKLDYNRIDLPLRY